MNLTWQIIKKDLFHYRWALAAWLGMFVYLVFLQSSTGWWTSSQQDYFRFFAILMLVVLSVALQAGIVQQDHPTDSAAFWRTRPISPGRLLMAKLTVLAGLFIAVPVLAVLVKHQADGLKTVDRPSEYGLMILVLATVTLSYAAAAACTKTTVQSLALWVCLIFAAGSFASLLSDHEPTVSRKFVNQLTQAKVLSILGFSVVAALAVIANQYLRRRTAVSIALFVVGCMGPAVIGTAWSYYYFYHS
jgi:hypothetical protein